VHSTPRRTVASTLVLLALSASNVGARGREAAALHRLPFRATLTAPTHRPKANTKWYYTVGVASLKGKPIAARITVQIRDPLGTLHPVLYANTRKKIVNWPIPGHFRDYIIWPRSSAVGIALTLRVAVTAAGHKKVLNYQVIPKS
jgi:hypothetical protein